VRLSCNKGRNIDFSSHLMSYTVYLWIMILYLQEPTIYIKILIKALYLADTCFWVKSCMYKIHLPLQMNQSKCLKKLKCANAFEEMNGGNLSSVSKRLLCNKGRNIYFSSDLMSRVGYHWITIVYLPRPKVY